MPVYDYRCDHCGNAFSAVRSYTDEPLAACPRCGRPPRKVVSSPSIVFKGSGWYKTDSRGAPPAEGGKAPEKKADKVEKAGAPENPADKKDKKKDGGAAKAEGTSAKGEAAS
ncbi:MAG TPA: FmdB family zinc ribbon protein [Candidatus Limnocylindrales bacterium]|nr:FmdB family zinc ribbon protein [Candidatus Limnocylindrales bacterium]